MTSPRIYEHAAGLTWVLEDEAMQRACHALAFDGRVWLVDPIDTPEPLERAAGLGEIVGVLQLLDRHNRDCKAIAERLGVPLHRLPDALPGTPFEVRKVIEKAKWKERALWEPQSRTLVVSEGVGSVDAFAVSDDPVGVHPMLRPFGVGALRGYAPELLLMGHGAPVSGPTTAAALGTALDRSRKDIPKLLTKLPGIIRGK
ncbi:MAG: hypothetical protein H0V81_15810 [Solirubrobacterales bacterium]|nr:hypothetical protein [Solirubrobacterales bacterium]